VGQILYRSVDPPQNGVKDLLSKRVEKSAPIVPYDNDASLFSASLFAIGNNINKSAPRPSAEIMEQLIEMGFSAGSIKREYRKILQIDPETEPSVEILVSKLVETEHETDSDLEEDSDTDGIQSYSSDDQSDDLVKSRTDFEGLPFEYDSYVLENVSENCPVKALQSIDCQLSSRGNIVIPTGTNGKDAVF